MSNRRLYFWIIAVAVPVLAVVISACISLRIGDWSWFGRSGSLLCVSGAAVVIRDLFIGGVKEYAKTHNYFGFVDSTDYPSRANIREARITYAGFFLATVGTVIWAYGDLLPNRHQERASTAVTAPAFQETGRH